MLDTSVLDGRINRRQEPGPLVAACSNNGYLETIDGHLYCRCVEHWAGRYCHEACNRHGVLQADGQTCECADGWSSNANYPARWGSLQCNMVTCDFANNRRQTLPGDWYGYLNLDDSCGLAPRQVSRRHRPSYSDVRSVVGGVLSDDLFRLRLRIPHKCSNTRTRSAMLSAFSGTQLWKLTAAPSCSTT